MRVAITGATGFLGSHLLDALEAHDGQIAAIARRKEDVATLAARGVDAHLGEVTDLAALERCFEGADVVAHLAGLVAARDEAAFASVNAFGARLAARAARACGARRFVLVSSLAARGPLGARGPVSRYGRSKLAGERAVAEEWRGAGGLIVVRPTAVYGPRDRALRPAFWLARRGLRPVLASSARLTFVHAADLARGLAGLALGAEELGASPLEASDGRDYSWSELARWLGEATGRPGEPHGVPLRLAELAAWLSDLGTRLGMPPPIFGRDKLVEMRGDWSADAGPFWSAAGVEPRFELRSGLLDTALSLGYGSAERSPSGG